MVTKRRIAFQIALSFLIFSGLFTLFRTALSSVFSLYYLNFNISKSDISYIKSFQNLGMLVSFLPVGIISDYIGRKKMLLLSTLIVILGFVILLLSSTLCFFALAEFVYGVGLAANSGVLLAFTTDLEELNAVDIPPEVMGRRTSVMNLCTLIGGLIGSTLYSVDYQYPIWFAVIGLTSYLLSLVVWLHLTSLTTTKKRIKIPKWDIRLPKITGRFLMLILVNSLFECGIQFVLIYWSIYYVDQLGYPLQLVFVYSTVSLIAGSELFAILVKKMAISKLLIYNSGLFLVSLVTIAVTTIPLVSLGLFGIVEVGVGVMSSAILLFERQVITSENNKSALLSVSYFVTESVLICVLIGNKYMFAMVGLKSMFAISSLFFGLLMVVLLRQRRLRNDGI